MADEAKSIIRSFLSQYGLESLGDWAWDQYLNGASVEQIMLDIRERPEYKQRFPAMEQLAQAGEAISEIDYINYEKTTRQLLQQYGITPGLYDTPEGIAQLLINRVSTVEVNARLQQAAAAAYSTPQEVLDGLRAMGYDLQAGSLASFYLDADRALPLIEQQYRAAQVYGAAAQQKIALDVSEAERLAKQGISWQQAQEGFRNVAATAALASGEGETVGQGTRVAAAFGDQAALEATTRVQKGRRARFAGSGGAAESQQGAVGLGGAST